jgi:hypothetical protein
MAIEVRQVTIKSVISAAPAEPIGASTPTHESERIKEEILAECRQMVLEILRAERER